MRDYDGGEQDEEPGWRQAEDRERIEGRGRGTVDGDTKLTHFIVLLTVLPKDGLDLRPPSAMSVLNSKWHPTGNSPQVRTSCDHR